MSILYLVFRTLMRKQTFFQLNRVILLSIIVFPTIIPLVHLPQTIQPDISFQLVPVPNKIEVYNTDLQEEVDLTRKDGAGQPMKTNSPHFAIPWPQLLQLIYLSGLIVALLASLTGFLKILILFHKEQVISKDGFRLLIAKDDIPAFSLGRYMFISRSDFETSGETILTHEQAHIRNGHFYDLIVLEFVKIFYWFNPVNYWLIRDLKAVHEYQADESTLNNGIDATLYQLLIIEKCVGHKKFALANSFNHCQIKNRIVMMNKQKSNKAWRWKAVAFLPILALLLMAFGRTQNISNTLDNKMTGNMSELIVKNSDKIKIDEKKSVLSSNSKLNLQEPKGSIVKGKVILSDGRPLQKSSVTIKGTNNRVITDKDGRFKFDNVPKDGELVFQNLGLITSFVKPDFKNFMIIKMEPGSFWIDPVKVIGHVIDQTPPAALPKVSFASHMTINPPLFIVDGEMADKSKMDQIEHDDVAFVNVLKGKSATDKYGPMAKNGALEIKTKKKVILPAQISKVNVEVNEYSDNQKMDIHSNNVIEEMPEFVGGMKELMKFIADNIKYPDQALTDKAQGNIEVNFIINQNGVVEKAKVAKDVHPALDAEAIRVISSMPDWNPGKQGGKSVDVSLTIPIRFSLK